MRGIQWNMITIEQLDSTAFKQIDDANVKVDLDKIEELFGIKKVETAKEGLVTMPEAAKSVHITDNLH